MAEEPPPPTPPRGALIAIEGLDRAGKTTQCSLLLDRLRAAGVSARLQKFPDRTTAIGQMINSYLQSSAALDDQAVHLLFSANRWEARDSILSTLAAGTTLLLDRYVHSGIVFSAAKRTASDPAPHPPHGPLSTAWCRAPDVGLPRPDIVIFLSISQDAASTRAGFGDERYEQTEMQARVRTLFDQIREDPRDAADWWHVDASGSVEQVAEDVWRGVQEGLKRASERGDEIRVFE